MADDKDKKHVYDESKIKTLSSIEHIRLRTGMYIGRIGDGSHYEDGCYILLKEVIDNAIDEFIMGYGKEVDMIATASKMGLLTCPYVFNPEEAAAIREALVVFGRRIRGFDMADAVLTGVETRTSSPIRIARDDTFQSLNTRGLFPAGEGAGYAGGILSAGIDGIKVAEAVAKSIVTD